MVLVDTSVWVDHLREGDDRFRSLVSQQKVLMHPMIRGELACGNLRNRSQLLRYWQNLPQITLASDDEVMHLLEYRSLYGRGIGFVDLHLLASCLITADTELWTKDRRLNAVAQTLSLVTHWANG